MKVVVLYKLPPKPKAWDRLVLAIVEHGRRVERPVSQGEVVELADVGRRERSLLELGHIAEMQDPDYSKTGVDPSEVARILAGPSGGARVETIAIAPEGELDAPPFVCTSIPLPPRSSIPDPAKFKCPCCDFWYPTAQNMVDHFSEKHPDVGTGTIMQRLQQAMGVKVVECLSVDDLQRIGDAVHTDPAFPQFETLPGVSEPVDEVHRVEIDDVTGEVTVNRPVVGGDLPIDPPAMLFETFPEAEPIGIPTSAHPATVDSDPPQKRRRPGRPKGSRNKPKA